MYNSAPLAVPDGRSSRTRVSVPCSALDLGRLSRSVLRSVLRSVIAAGYHSPVPRWTWDD